MSAHAPIAAMLAARHALERSNPELLAWSRAQWQTWLQKEQRETGTASAVAVARLTCLEDLPCHVGLMRILAGAAIRPPLVLTFPTEEMARLARSQARREGWGGLVRMVAEAESGELLPLLAGDAQLFAFPAPALAPTATFDTSHDDGLNAAFRELFSLDPTKLPPPPPSAGLAQVAEAAQPVLQVLPTQLKPWMLSAFLNRGGAGNAVVRAFAQGVGCRIAFAEDEPDVLHDIPVVWGVLRGSDRIVAQAKAQLLHFFYIDHAYFDRGHGKSYRITCDRYEAGPVRRCPSDRIDALKVEVRPWRKFGREIIVCPPTDYFMAAHGCSDWLETTLATLRSVTDRPIVVRQKPQPGEDTVPLVEALETAHALVTHSSNVAIEAACLGTPVFVDPASAAAPIGRTDLSQIEDPAYAERHAWLAHLAYNQFAFDEIQNGRAWKMLLELEEREHV
jgi:hypothetical protein